MKLLVVEDLAMVREVIVKFCRAEAALAEIEEAANGAEALSCCERMKPDVILLDLDFPEVSGIGLLDQLVAVAPRSKIVVLSHLTEEYALHRCLQAGVKGYLQKSVASADSLIQAIQSAAQGRSYLGAPMQRVKLRHRLAPGSFIRKLSEREEAVLRLVGLGLGPDEIADRLRLSHLAIENCQQNMMAKLDLPGTLELAVYALRNGFARLPVRFLPSASASRSAEKE